MSALNPDRLSAILTESEKSDETATPGFLTRRRLWNRFAHFVAALGSSRRQDESQSAPRVVLTWGTNGHGNGEFDIPIAVAVNQKDEVLVTDFRQGTPKPSRACSDSIKRGGFWEASRPTPCPADWPWTKMAFSMSRI